MSKQSQTDFDTVVERGKAVIHKGSRRHVVFRNANGDELADITFNTAAVLALVLLFIQPLGGIAFIGLVIYGVTQNVRIEIMRELTDSDEVLSLDNRDISQAKRSD